jgi:lysylphosphatidylglycerol synthetase-like protein (DUF2156 family)
MKRSILAVFCGVLTIGVLALAGDSLMRRIVPAAFDANGSTTISWVLLVTLVYTVLFSALGGWVTARISRTWRDVIILAGLQFVMTLAANVVLFERSLLWYYAAVLVLGTVAILAGGRVSAA